MHVKVHGGFFIEKIYHGADKGVIFTERKNKFRRLRAKCTSHEKVPENRH